ncbi:MAG: hypothetical protein KGH71_05535 [Candidatus Micrarchaeota archaeon]|nr:hypothetical protein [Candidatus Micrarchaeota archaeon]
MPEILLKDAAVIRAPLQGPGKVAYSTDRKITGKAFELRISNDPAKKKEYDQNFVGMGFFEIRSFASLQRDGHSTTPVIDVNKELFTRQARRNILNQTVWDGPNPLDYVIGFPKLIAELYDITLKTTVALFPEPFLNAWEFRKAVEKIKSSRDESRFYA